MPTWMRPTGRLCAAVAVVGWISVLVATPAVAHNGDHRNDEVPSVRAIPTSEPMVADGRLDEAVWQQAPISQGFRQRNPVEGDPISKPTQFRVVYTPDTLYIGIEAFDDDADRLVAREMQRDGALYRDDGLVVLIDTFHDHRNAYMFETNPNGARTDSVMSDEGRTTNFAWDGIWSVGTSVSAEGWIAEFAIPFSTLRFDPAADRWGLNIRRLIRRDNEIAFWSHIALDANLWRASRYGHIEGLENLEVGRNLQIKPFAVGNHTDVDGTGSNDDTEVGLDVKWGVTRNLNLDLTYNTDFAEVESDNLQVNLTRFSLFFPEKREFFLENSGIFQFGPGTPELEMFFSRRIGIAPDGRQVPMRWGARLTGRVDGWNIGVLDAETDAIGAEGDLAAIPKTNWGVLRVQRNLGERSVVGALFTNRDGGDTNRAYGLDANLNPTDRLNVTGFWARTEDPAGDDWAGGIGLDWGGSEASWGLDVQEIGEDFKPDMGFVLRRGLRRYAGYANYRPRPEMAAVRNFIHQLNGEAITRLDDSLESLRVNSNFFGMSFESGDWFEFFARHRFEDLDEPFEIFEEIVIPAGEHRFQAFGVRGGSEQSRKVSGFISYEQGEFFNGDRRSHEVSLRLRPNRYLRTETEWNFNDIELPGGSMETNLLIQRIAVALSPDLSIDALVQYSDLAENLALNLRFHWIFKPGADLFLVYNHNWDAPSLGRRTDRDRQVILKVAYPFTF